MKIEIILYTNTSCESRYGTEKVEIDFISPYLVLVINNKADTDTFSFNLLLASNIYKHPHFKF